MTFASLNEFFAMGGHGLYVWAAWGVTALLMLGILLHARLERRQLIKAVKRRMRREKAQRTASPYGATPAPNPVNSAQGDVRNDA
ncbi:heme exporter protein CcmD [Halomonas sp. KM072]